MRSGYQEIVDISFKDRQGQSKRSKKEHLEETNNSAVQQDETEILEENDFIDSLENADDVSTTVFET